MRSDNFFFLGAGGHARVVVDAFSLTSAESVFATFVDDDPSLWGTNVLGFPVIGGIEEKVLCGSRFHVAIGENHTRHLMMKRMLTIGALPFSVIHPSAHVSRFAKVGIGCFIAAGAIVAPMVTIGKSVILNHGSVVDHDCVVGDFCHIAPNASLAGGVHLGRNVLVGAGARVMMGVSVADDAVIGAGAVVLRDVSAQQVVAGVPAKLLGRNVHV